MTNERPLVLVRRPTAAAVLRVERVLELGNRLPFVLDSEVHDAGPARELGISSQVGDQRIVGVQRELSGAGMEGDHGGPLVGQVLELAIAVELVAKQVSQRDEARPEL